MLISKTHLTSISYIRHIKPTTIVYMSNTAGLSSLQLELLKVYSFNPSEEELLEIKAFLAKFFAKRLTTQVRKAVEHKGITEADLENWLNEPGQ